MSIVAPANTHAGPSAARIAARFRIRLLSRWQDVSEELLACCGTPTPFQDRHWLDAWYAAFASKPGIMPLIALASDAATGELALVLPMVRRRRHGIDVAEFADLELTDYNAPLTGPAAPRDAATARKIWRDLRRALCAAGVDVLRLRKMPLPEGGIANPFALLAGTRGCALNGNLVTTGEDFDAWRYTLERTVRKELERSWRVFTREPAAAFCIAANEAEALRILGAMEQQQSTRMHALGANYGLDDEACAEFYRALVRRGVASGYAVVSALTVRDEIVAALLGVIANGRYIMVRISHAGGRWSNCSPGRLIIVQTMAALHARGLRQFDFSIGNYSYKRRFGVAPLALVDLTLAVSWRGLPFVVRDRAAAWLRSRPQLHHSVLRLFGRPPSREEGP